MINLRETKPYRKEQWTAKLQHPTNISSFATPSDAFIIIEL